MALQPRIQVANTFYATKDAIGYVSALKEQMGREFPLIPNDAIAFTKQKMEVRCADIWASREYLVLQKKFLEGVRQELQVRVEDVDNCKQPVRIAFAKLAAFLQGWSDGIGGLIIELEEKNMFPTVLSMDTFSTLPTMPTQPPKKGYRYAGGKTSVTLPPPLSNPYNLVKPDVTSSPAPLSSPSKVAEPKVTSSPDRND